MNWKGHGTIRRPRNRAGTSGPRLAYTKETPRRKITFTSSSDKKNPRIILEISWGKGGEGVTQAAPAPFYSNAGIFKQRWGLRTE